jgi:prolyl-tRNA editing enzyme YbaK/EbsC (Cys-tRNA(Pro) deacylase)
MTVESVRAFLSVHAPDIDILETDASSATVELAAQGHGVQPAQIAKTLSLRIKDRTLLVVASGTARLNNRKVKDVLGGKPRMLTADEVMAATGHPVGGVCPFGLATPLAVYCDLSLKAFDEVVPAAGSTHSALRISPARMAELVNAEWVDVCDAYLPTGSGSTSQR